MADEPNEASLSDPASPDAAASAASDAGPAGGGSAAPDAGRRRRWPAVLLALGLLLAALALAWHFLGAPDDGMEPNVVVGPMGDYSREELEAMLAQKVDEGMIAFSLNTQMHLEAPDAEAPILFENPANNAKLLKLEITRDDTGETVYETGYLAPGSYVERDRLDVRLDPGSYTCTALITSYRQDTKKPLGQAAAEVTISVQDPAQGSN